MTVHTKLIMRVSLQNKGERHVQPQQGPKLIPQPQSRHTAQHADAQTCRNTCADPRASTETYIYYILYRYCHAFLLSLYLDCKHTFKTFSTQLCSDDATFELSRLQCLNICSPHEHHCIHFIEECVSTTIT